MTDLLNKTMGAAAALALSAQPLSAQTLGYGSAPVFFNGPAGYPFNSNPALVRAQPNPTSDVAPYASQFVDDFAFGQRFEGSITQALRNAVKYVFVIFNENRSFDHEYGTFPGVNGLYSDGVNPRSPANTPGYTQTYTDKLSGATVTVQPFLIGPQQNANVIDSLDHSHTGLATKLDVVNGVPQMDKFAYDQYVKYATGATPTTAGEKEGAQFARLVMSHIDCNTIPFFWYYASRFTIFDNIFATEDTPSTPNAIAMIAGQSGETQWVKHGNTGATATVESSVCGVSSGSGTLVPPPIVGDSQPFYGSEFDGTTSNREPASCNDGYSLTNITSVLTFASIPLTLQGSSIESTMATDRNPSVDLADIQNDIPYIAAAGQTPVAWRWYQEGYDHEPTDPAGVTTNSSFVSHHDGAQYFGYIADNPSLSSSLKGLGDFFNDIANGNLPPEGGVIYIRGGYTNIQGFTPAIQNSNWPTSGALAGTAATNPNIAAINAAKSGDDNHPSYSDAFISEALAARVINAVAGNPTLWSQSAIIITYDESDGLYDHVPPQILSYGPDGLPLARGIRIPLILISPYAHAHAVSDAIGDHNAIIETINTIFNLPPLSTLPDEAAALAAGNSPAFNQFGPAGFQQQYLGPRDTPSPATQSLLSGFDLARLLGIAPPLPASLATIPSSVVNSMPHYGGAGCSAIGVTPVLPQGASADFAPPAGFNTLPSTLPNFN